MRAVLVGIDYVKDIDNTFKILEINTNIAIPNFNPLLYMNVDTYQQFLIDNGITSVDFIFTQGNLVGGYYKDLENQNLSLPPSYLPVLGMKTTEVSGVTFNSHQLLNNGTIPNIEDASNKLIIRQSYDNSALIDYDYARDNFQFLKLMHDHDSASIPKTYFSHFTLGIDMIDTIRDNGIHPNFIIKKRYPSTNGGDYPKLYKITTSEELNQLKTNLGPDELLQEYVYNPNDLLNNRIKTYRSVDLMYGSLDVLNLFHPFEHSNPMVLTTDTDYTDTLEVQAWDRPKYIQKTTIRSCDSLLKLYKCDDTNVILKSDNTLVSPNQLNNNDTLMSVNIPTLPLDGGKYASWTGDTNTILTDITLTGTTIVDIQTQEFHMWIKTITLNDGTVFSDTLDAAAMVDYSGTTKFTKFFNLQLGDEIFVYDSENDIVKKLTITDIGISYSKENAYLIDVEESDVYMVAEESTVSPKIFLIEHNLDCTAYWWYGDTNCEVVGADWSNFPPPGDEGFAQYSWFCGQGCGFDWDQGQFSNSCECRDFYENSYGLPSNEAAWACRYFCCGTTPENCGVLENPFDCDQYYQIDPPCGCVIPNGTYDCGESKGGYPDVPSLPPGV